jgi:hypothetical protein
MSSLLHRSTIWKHVFNIKQIHEKPYMYHDNLDLADLVLPATKTEECRKASVFLNSIPFVYRKWSSENQLHMLWCLCYIDRQPCFEIRAPNFGHCKSPPQLSRFLTANPTILHNMTIVSTHFITFVRNSNKGEQSVALVAWGAGAHAARPGSNPGFDGLLTEFFFYK